MSQDDVDMATVFINVSKRGNAIAMYIELTSVQAGEGMISLHKHQTASSLYQLHRRQTVIYSNIRYIEGKQLHFL